ncbi:hypothetical protein CEQ36_01440 [Yersinia intermedia]|nr:hypothetical protein A6J67_23240 [Yersinia sp. FDAARGOS_228]AVL34417.1 hypothetical protein CEQ36_01440 [Yersinia intermedia]
MNNCSAITIDLTALYTRHTSSCMSVGRLRSPQSLTCVSSGGLAQLPPSCNSNYLGYRNSQINSHSKKNAYQPAILAQPDLE